MTNTLSTKIRAQAMSLVAFQLLLIGCISLLSLVLIGQQQAISLLMGGFCYAIPNLFFVWFVFRYSSAHEMNKFLVAFMLGETLKLILSGILFILVVKTLQISLSSVVVGLGIAIVSFWVACLIRFSKPIRL